MSTATRRLATATDIPSISQVCRVAFAPTKFHQQVYGRVDEADYLSFRNEFFAGWLKDPGIAILVIEDVVDNLREIVAFAIWTLPGHHTPSIPSQPAGTDLDAVKRHFDTLTEMEADMQKELGDHYTLEFLTTLPLHTGKCHASSLVKWSTDRGDKPCAAVITPEALTFYQRCGWKIARPPLAYPDGQPMWYDMRWTGSTDWQGWDSSRQNSACPC